MYDKSQNMFLYLISNDFYSLLIFKLIISVTCSWVLFDCWERLARFLARFYETLWWQKYFFLLISSFLFQLKKTVASAPIYHRSYIHSKLGRKLQIYVSSKSAKVCQFQKNHTYIFISIIIKRFLLIWPLWISISLKTVFFQASRHKNNLHVKFKVSSHW